jgi:hypothetical protein
MSRVVHFYLASVLTSFFCSAIWFLCVPFSSAKADELSDALEAVYEALNFEPPKDGEFPSTHFPGQMIMSEAIFHQPTTSYRMEEPITFDMFTPATSQSVAPEQPGEALYDFATMRK